MVVHAGNHHVPMHYDHVKSLGEWFHTVALTEIGTLDASNETREDIEERSFLLETPDIRKIQGTDELRSRMLSGKDMRDAMSLK